MIKSSIFIKNYRKILIKLDSFSRYVLVFTMGFMTVLVITQVFFRYALSNSIDWADEVSRLMFVWSMFLAIPHGVRAGAHVGIDVLLNAFNERVRDATLRTMMGVSSLLVLIVFYYSIYVIIDKWQEQMPTVDITSAVYYIPVTISMGHCFFHLLFLAMAGNKAWAVVK